MTVEQCCETLFNSMEALAIMQLILIGVCGLISSVSLNRIEKKLDKLLEEQKHETKR